jgi:hypothetical protein
MNNIDKNEIVLASFFNEIEKLAQSPDSLGVSKKKIDPGKWFRKQIQKWWEDKKRKGKEKLNPNKDIPVIPGEPEVPNPPKKDGDKIAQVDVSQYPAWVQEALTTGIQETDKEGKVIGNISPEALIKFIEKNPPVDANKQYWQDQEEKRGPADTGVKEFWDKQKEDIGAADEDVASFWANQKYDVDPQEDLPEHQVAPEDALPSYDVDPKEPFPVDAKNSPTPTSNVDSDSKVQTNEPRGHTLSQARVNPNISGNLGRDGRVNNIFKRIMAERDDGSTKNASAMPVEGGLPHEKMTKKQQQFAEFLAKKYKNKKKKNKSSKK